MDWIKVNVQLSLNIFRINNDRFANDAFDKMVCMQSTRSSQRLCILRKSWRVFHERLLLGKCFHGFVLLVLEYCSAVWCSAADTHFKLMDRALSGARCLTTGAHVLDCDITHGWPVAVLCMLYKIRCNPMDPLYSALPVPYMPVRVTRGALVAHRYIYLCASSIAVPLNFYSLLSVSVEQMLIGWCGTITGIKIKGIAFLFA